MAGAEVKCCSGYLGHLALQALLKRARHKIVLAPLAASCNLLTSAVLYPSRAYVTFKKSAIQEKICRSLCTYFPNGVIDGSVERPMRKRLIPPLLLPHRLAVKYVFCNTTSLDLTLHSACEFLSFLECTKIGSGAEASMQAPRQST